MRPVHDFPTSETCPGFEPGPGGRFQLRGLLPGINKLDGKCWANGLAGKARESGARLRSGPSVTPTQESRGKADCVLSPMDMESLLLEE